MNEDISDDPLGRECITERDTIRFWIAIAKDQVRTWNPAPCPEEAAHE